jgi:Fe-S-cluster-containing dehydrogenase component
MGCPYGVRFFHPVHKWLTMQLLLPQDKPGMKTACVDARPFEARRIGNLKDLNDPVTKIIMSDRVGVLKDEYGPNLRRFTSAQQGGVSMVLRRTLTTKELFVLPNEYIYWSIQIVMYRS